LLPPPKILPLLNPANEVLEGKLQQKKPHQNQKPAFPSIASALKLFLKL
jgi:hypothetical protein